MEPITTEPVMETTIQKPKKSHKGGIVWGLITILSALYLGATVVMGELNSYLPKVEFYQYALIAVFLLVGITLVLTSLVKFAKSSR